MGTSHSVLNSSSISRIALKVDSHSSAPDASEHSDWNTFDYVVVGGGTAGCVLASRLSQDSSVSVLLVEAGKSYVLFSHLLHPPMYSLDANRHEGDLMTSIPLAFAKLFKSDADWDYETTYAGSPAPPPNTLYSLDMYRAQQRLQNRQVYWPRGKILGGTRWR